MGSRTTQLCSGTNNHPGFNNNPTDLDVERSKKNSEDRKVPFLNIIPLLWPYGLELPKGIFFSFRNPRKVNSSEEICMHN